MCDNATETGEMKIWGRMGEGLGEDNDSNYCRTRVIVGHESVRKSNYNEVAIDFSKEPLTKLRTLKER